MEPKAPDGWERLTCLCGQNKFAPVTFLRWRPGAGVTQEQGGFFCLECHGVVDTAALIQKAQVKIKQRELKELESELDDVAPAMAAAAKPASKKGA